MTHFRVALAQCQDELRARCRIILACALAALLPQLAMADPIPAGGQAQKMEVVGFTALQGRAGAFKLSIKQSKGRWYLFAGHQFHRGFSIIDVTDPAAPRYVKFVPSPAEWSDWTTAQVTLHGDVMITALNNWAGWGPKPPPAAPAVLIWDISNPENPRQVGQWQGGPVGSHRNSYPGGKYAYLSTSMPGFSKNLLVILDVSNPAQPHEVSRWWMPGQKQGEPRSRQVEPSFHGPVNVSPDGRMASLGYSPSVVNLDLSDITRPRLIGELQMVPPFPDVGAQSLHTVLPLWDRKLLFASSEALKPDCADGLHYAVLIDNADPAKPRLISMFPTPRPPEGAAYKDFCAKGGRFGPHNVNQEIHLPDVEKPGNLMYIAYFNAGLRIYDISNPLLPTETAWFLPPERPGADRGHGYHASDTNWTEDVLVDTRGNIFISDLKWGIWALRYAGAGQPVQTAR